MGNIDLTSYETVEERIARFKADHPNFRVLTDLVSSEGEVGQTRWIVKASVWRDASSGDVPDATGYAFEVDGAGMTQRTAALETCETSAIGRALANIGYAGNKRVTREEMIKQLVAEYEQRIAEADSKDAVKSIYEEARADGVEKRLNRATNRRLAQLGDA